MVRLTADLILNSSSYFNALKERELNLRGNKIALIENLGATQDQFDCVDLSDNEIVKLDGFPLLNRLRTLLLNNNLISSIASGLGEQLPNLDTLILTNNRLNNLSDIDVLSEMKSLRRLSLLENGLTKKQHYRLYVINKLPHLKLLDFRKVKQKERAAAAKLFSQSHLQSQSHSQIQTQQVPSKESKSAGSQPTQSDVAMAAYNQARASDSQAIKNAIASASSLAEVAQLERTLAAGQVPHPNK